MAYAINPRSPVPSYRQLAGLLREEIDAGRYDENALLPSIRTLVQETGLAVMTVRHAFEVLEAEGLVVVVPGRGTFAATPQERAEARRTQQG